MAPPPYGLGPEKALYDYLNPILSGLEVELFHMAAPEGQAVDKGYVTYQRVSTAFDHTLQNTSQFIVCYFQIDAYGPTMSMVADIAWKIRYALTGHSQAPTPIGSSSHQIVGVLPENEFTGYEWDEKLNRRTMMFKVMMREATSDEGGGGPLP
jgi:hypothetical protein